MEVKGVVGASGPKWYPIVELPDTSTGHVKALVLLDDGSAVTALFPHNRTPDPDELHDTLGRRITHWMPFPEPPKAGD